MVFSVAALRARRKVIYDDVMSASGDGSCFSLVEARAEQRRRGSSALQEVGKQSLGGEPLLLLPKQRSNTFQPCLVKDLIP